MKINYVIDQEHQLEIAMQHFCYTKSMCSPLTSVKIEILPRFVAVILFNVYMGCVKSINIEQLFYK